MQPIVKTALRSGAQRVQHVRRLSSVLPYGETTDPSSGRPTAKAPSASLALLRYHELPTNLVHTRSFHTTCPTLIGGGGIRTRRRRGSAAALKEKKERQRQGEEVGETPTSTQLLVSEEEFTVAAVELLDKVHAAMVPLQRLNQGMNLMRGKAAEGHELHVPSRDMRKIQNINVVPENNEEEEAEEDKKDDEEEMTTLRGEYLLIDLGPVHGQYTLQSDVAKRVLRLQSPLSGAIPYRWDAHTLDWCSLLDNHNLVGLLVRDLIRQIQGVPNL